MSADPDPTGEFSVYQFFSNGDYEEVLRYVDPKTAVDTAKALTESIGGRILGTTARVIITDGGDYTTFEWQHGKGVVFPTEADCAAAMP
jgi:hypothetical protein